MLVRKLVVIVSVVVVCGLCWSGVAGATVVHRYTSSFGVKGSGPGQFDKPVGVAVDDTTHDVYVVDQGNNRVEEFDAAGTFICEFAGAGSKDGSLLEPTAIAVDNSAGISKGDVYVVDRGRGVIDKFNSLCAYQGELTGAGTPGGKFEPFETSNRSIAGIAIDPAGTVWVSLYKAPIYGFSDGIESGSPSEVPNIFGGIGEGLGVDAEDNLYLRITSGEYVKLDSTGGVLANPFGGDLEAHAVAVDPVGDEVYFDTFDGIEAFGLGGEGIESGQPGSLFPGFGGGHLTFSTGVAVDSSDSTVYATDESADDVSVFEGITLPEVKVGLLVGQSPRGVTLTGMVNPEGKLVSRCVFEYATAVEYEAGKAYSHSVSCESSFGSGTVAVPVQAKLSGLTPETSYVYRLVAENVGGASPTPNGVFFTGPVLGGEFVTDVTVNSATLRDSVDPNGADTHYYFEYGTSEGYGSFAPVSSPGVDLGSAAGAQNLSVHLQGLEPGVTYHYRLVAVQDGEIFEEADRSFTTESLGVSGALPDGRMWELVSPPNKKGTLIELLETGGQVQAAADGSGIAYMTEGGSVAENAAGKLQRAQVLSRRGPGGWGTVDLTLPDTLPENGEAAEVTYAVQPEYHLFSPDLSLAVVEPEAVGTPPLSPEVTERTLYLRDDLSESFVPLVRPANVPAGTQIEEHDFNNTEPLAWEMHFLAATPDLSHVIFKTPLALTPEAIDEETLQEKHEKHEAAGGNEIQWNLYEWSGGQLQLVNILPEPGDEVAHGPYPKFPQVRLAGTTSATGLAYGGAQRDVSNDGRRVAWTWGEPSTGDFRGLFVRDMVEGRTVRVGGAYPFYQTMNSDGSKIFYLENGDLYVYDFETESSTDLTGQDAGVQENVSDVSEDGSSVYFVASGVLAPGGVSGADNLYLLHDTNEGWTTTYIAGLSAQDRPSWYAEGYQGVALLAGISSRVSPNGRFLVFMSDRSLTGYDNTDAVSGQPDEEVFLYDAQSGKLACTSCDPTGARPTGVLDSASTELLIDHHGVWTSKETSPSDVKFDHWLAGSVPGWDNLSEQSATYQPRYLSDSGRVFFDSPVGLVAQDTNGLEDVYEFEPAGVGSCVVGGTGYSDRSGGCVSLISSGTSSAESAFYDASEDGDDVFFDTTAKLVGADYDKGYDLYDAHVCSGEVPCVSEPVAVPPCTSGDSCKAAPMPQPQIFGPPPTATFDGGGNIVTPPTTANVKKKVLTSAQKLAAALKACHKEKGKRRAACEKQARKRYPVRKTKKVAAAKKKGGQ